MVKIEEENPYAGQIDKDLFRSFPTSAYFKEGEGPVLLRRILNAYSFYDKNIGMLYTCFIQNCIRICPGNELYCWLTSLSFL